MQSHASLAILAAAMIALSACGGGGGGSSPQPVGTPPPPPPPPTNNAPDITSGSDYAVTEMFMSVGTMSATDADGDTLTWSLAGNNDDALFSIDGQTGALRFRDPPHMARPRDLNADGVYTVTLGVNDGQGGSDQQDLMIRVNNHPEDRDVDYVQPRANGSGTQPPLGFGFIGDLDDNGTSEAFVVSTGNTSETSNSFIYFTDPADFTPGATVTMTNERSFILTETLGQGFLAFYDDLAGTAFVRAYTAERNINGAIVEKAVVHAYNFSSGAPVAGGTDASLRNDPQWRQRFEISLENGTFRFLKGVGAADQTAIIQRHLGARGTGNPPAEQTIFFQDAWQGTGVGIVDLDSAQPTDTVRLTGLATIATGGLNVGMLGDLDGDALAEIVFWGEGDTNTGSTEPLEEGFVRIVSGQALIDARGGILDIGTLQPGRVMEITSGGLDESVTEFFASDIGSIPDIDGDGRDEIIVGRYRPDGLLGVIVSGAALVDSPDGGVDLSLVSATSTVGIYGTYEPVLTFAGFKGLFDTVPTQNGNGRDVVVARTGVTGNRLTRDQPQQRGSYIIKPDALVFGTTLDLNGPTDGSVLTLIRCDYPGWVELDLQTSRELVCDVILPGGDIAAIRADGGTVIDIRDL